MGGMVTIDFKERTRVEAIACDLRRRATRSAWSTPAATTAI
ncbi:MAG: hypothetical protein ACLUI3_14260 [Christensenellales bacterium]